MYIVINAIIHKKHINENIPKIKSIISFIVFFYFLFSIIISPSNIP